MRCLPPHHARNTHSKGPEIELEHGEFQQSLFCWKVIRAIGCGSATFHRAASMPEARVVQKRLTQKESGTHRPNAVGISPLPAG